MASQLSSDSESPRDGSNVFPSDYAKTNQFEFEAEMEKIYKLDTREFVNRAKSQSSDHLKKQIALVAASVAEKGLDGQVYTYVFKMNKDGSFTKTKTGLDQEGMPIV